jgi:aspartate aminotransferase/aminotransferase
MTGWRLGWVVASASLIEQLQKVQQFSFVCAPAPFQFVIPDSIKYQDDNIFKSYKNKRDKVFAKLGGKFELAKPKGAFYAFPKLEQKTGNEFVEKCIKNSVLVIPGNVFSLTDTHFRLSFAVKDEILEEALEVLVSI